MRKKIKGKLRSIIDYGTTLNSPVVWDDAIDEKNNYHFTINTKQHFVDSIEERFNDGEKIVIFLDGETKYPHVIVNKDHIIKRDMKWIDKEYRDWLKNHG